MKPYFLAPHVYPCVTEDFVVLLDLQRDKYVGVAREQMATLESRVKGWPIVGAGQAAESGASDVRSANTRADAVLEKMLAVGMLTTDPAVGKLAKPLEMARPQFALLEEDLETQPAVTWTHAARFLLASAVTKLAMKFRSIEAVMAGVSARKARRRASAGEPDLAAARKAVGAFIRLRPLLFGVQDACLFDSLALTRYLSYYGIFPDCVIGVHTGPFGAHCWVQSGSVVFNDAPEYVRRYKPIFSV